MEVGVSQLPRPAFFKDLERLLERRSGVSALIIVDGMSDSSLAMLERWVQVFRNGVITVAAGKAALKLPCLSGVKVIELGDWSGGKLPARADAALRSISPVPEIFVTGEPYDPYGVMVKTDLEKSLLPHIRDSGAVFLVHDAVYGTLRAYDTWLLRDRLYFRGLRIVVYKAVVRLIYALVRLISFGNRPGWRRV